MDRTPQLVANIVYLPLKVVTVLWVTVRWSWERYWDLVRWYGGLAIRFSAWRAERAIGVAQETPEPTPAPELPPVVKRLKTPLRAPGVAGHYLADDGTWAPPVWFNEERFEYVVQTSQGTIPAEDIADEELLLGRPVTIDDIKRLAGIGKPA